MKYILGISKKLNQKNRLKPTFKSKHECSKSITYDQSASETLKDNTKIIKLSMKLHHKHFDSKIAIIRNGPNNYSK